MQNMVNVSNVLPDRGLPRGGKTKNPLITSLRAGRGQKNETAQMTDEDIPRAELTQNLTIAAMRMRYKDKFLATSPILEPFLEDMKRAYTRMRTISDSGSDNESLISACTYNSLGSTLSTTEELYNQFIPFSSGGMGQLIKAHEKVSNREILIKTVKKGDLTQLQIDEAYQSLVEEFNIQSLLSHKNILEVEQLVTSINAPDKRCIVLPILHGPDLFEFMARDEFKAVRLKPAISEDISAPLMKQMMAATAHCHEIGIAHRDIKPENFVFNSPVPESDDVKTTTLKMIDFGGAAYTGVAPGCISATDEWISYKTHPGCFTWGYCAPEQLSDQSQFSVQCDLWSLGVIFFQMFHKCLPAHFVGYKSGEAMTIEILKRVPDYISSFFKISNPNSECCGDQLCAGLLTDVRFEQCDKALISKSAYCLLRRLLLIDPIKRITAAEAYAHPFLRDERMQ